MHYPSVIDLSLRRSVASSGSVRKGMMPMLDPLARLAGKSRVLVFEPIRLPRPGLLRGSDNNQPLLYVRDGENNEEITST